jgi:hypothetical protein
VAPTCESILAADLLAKYRAQGLELVGDEYAQNQGAQPHETPYGTIYKAGGVVCGLAGSDNGEEVTLSYAYGPIADADAEAQKAQALADGYVIDDSVSYERYMRDESGYLEGYAFGDGFWVATSDGSYRDQGDLLDAVVSTAPGF